MAGRWTVDRWILVATFACSAIAVVFGLGVQWSETTSVKASVIAINAALRQDYVRADVYASDQRRLSDAIERLTRALEAEPAPVVSQGRRPRTID